jgi:hypothetical protein
MAAQLSEQEKERKPVLRLGSQLRKRYETGTLNICKGHGRVLYLAISMLIAFCLLGEITFRQETVQKQMLGPQVGSRHAQFDGQWARLEKLVKEGQRIDCIFLGNSMVWIDVNPLIVSQRIKEVTGREISCFNFGVSALPASSAGLVAQVLVQKYHPKLLIYGTFARDYAIPGTAEDATAVSNTPWLKYQLGRVSPEGWLYDRSYFFKYKNYVADVLLFDLEHVIPGYNGFPPYHDYGFDPKIGTRINVNGTPNIDDVGSQDPHKWLYQYRILDEDLDGLRQIMRQSEAGVQIIVMEMPFYPVGFEFFLNGEDDYNKYVEQVTQLSEATGTAFWGLNEQPKIAAENWWDYFHMNIGGAKVFSEWLGGHLGDFLIQKSQNISQLDRN